MKFCPQCGVRLDQDEKFCHACGARLSGESAAQSTSAPQSGPAPARPLPQARGIGALVPLVLAILAVIILAIGIVHKKQKPANTSSTLPAKNEALIAKNLTDSILAFRSMAVIDAGAAFKKHASGRALKNIDLLNAQVWTITRPDVGWSWFLDISPFAVGLAASDHPLSAFYNPFADAMLILEWEKAASGYVISDLEIIPADCIRKAGKPPFDLNPSWKKAGIFPPEGIATSFLDSMKSFEEMFPVKGSADNWRATIGITDPELLKNIIRPAASLSMGQALLSLSEFRSASPGEPQCAEALRKAMREVLVKAGNDDMMSIVKVARVTLSETSPEPGTPFKVKAPSSAVFVLGTKSASVNG